MDSLVSPYTTQQKQLASEDSRTAYCRLTRVPAHR